MKFHCPADRPAAGLRPHRRSMSGPGPGEGPAPGLQGGRDRLRPGPDQRPLLQGHRRRHPGCAAGIRLRRPPVQAAPGNSRRDARDQRRLQDHHDARQAGHLFRGRPGLQGQEARAHRRGLCLQRQAPLRPAMEEPQPLPAGERQDRWPVGAAPGAHAREEAVRLRPRRRRPEDAGPLHLPAQARRGRPALRLPVQRRRFPGRRGARGGRVLRRQDHGAPGRHQRLAPGRMAAQLAHRAGEEPQLPRRALCGDRAAGRQRAAAGRGRRAAGQEAAAGGPRRHRHHRGGPAALAVLPQQRVRGHRGSAHRLRRHRDAGQQAGAQPRQAGHHDDALPAFRHL